MVPSGDISIEILLTLQMAEIQQKSILHVDGSWHSSSHKTAGDDIWPFSLSI